jgi:hypothetical protein
MIIFREFIIYYRKLTVIIISVFFSAISIQAQAFFTVLVVSAFSVLHAKAQPFQEETHNKIELISLGTSSILALFGLFFLSGSFQFHNFIK